MLETGANTESIYFYNIFCSKYEIGCGEGAEEMSRILCPPDASTISAALLKKAA